MAFGREFPHSFEGAYKTAKNILSSSATLMKRGTVDAEAEQIVAAAFRAVSGKLLTRMELFARMGDAFPSEAGEKVLKMAMGRAEGKLLQHLTGFQVFLDHEYEVGPEVLVPRPETEVLVVAAADELETQGDRPAVGIEIGVGSGIISIELLSLFEGLRMTGSELTIEARDCAHRNARRILGSSERLQIVMAPEPREVWAQFKGIVVPGTADFVISNPPYLHADAEVDPEVLEHEPWTALFAPKDDPLYFYRELARGAKDFVKPGGRVFAEVAHERAESTLNLFEEHAWSCRLEEDLAGRKRVLIGRKL